MLLITTRGLELRGAYGREASLKDWEDGKDFYVVGAHGAYCSIRDVEEVKKEGFDLLEFRKWDGTYVDTIVLNPLLKGLVSGPGQRVG